VGLCDWGAPGVLSDGEHGPRPLAEVLPPPNGSVPANCDALPAVTGMSP
jgi:hypothetical protein